MHHIVCRGIERRRIFKDDDEEEERGSFIERVGGILSETKTPCYAWVLIPNHFHILVRTGGAPLSTVMRRLLTGYAVSFDRRHHRSRTSVSNMPGGIMRNSCGQRSFPRQNVGTLRRRNDSERGRLAWPYSCIKIVENNLVYLMYQGITRFSNIVS